MEISRPVHLQTKDAGPSSSMLGIHAKAFLPNAAFRLSRWLPSIQRFPALLYLNGSLFVVLRVTYRFRRKPSSLGVTAIPSAAAILASRLPRDILWPLPILRPTTKRPGGGADV